ncbi:hypothetical protein J1N35_014761 [Gossypium stocksii]|uniref:Uncharacterized protein n=1 Tax=Gossypium stocksii TaxID=47602 RepID=A0A9D3VUP7_9ROSI|nr:hypothetical protein J1N35_014761 [Gossypium stocksii]
MVENSREPVGEDMNSHVPTLEQATTANNNVGNTENVFTNMLYTKMTLMFEQFMGTELE